MDATVPHEGIFQLDDPNGAPAKRRVGKPASHACLAGTAVHTGNHSAGVRCEGGGHQRCEPERPTPPTPPPLPAAPPLSPAAPLF